MPVPSRGLYWPRPRFRPAACLPGLISDLPHRCGHPWRPVGCVLTLVTITRLDPDPALLTCSWLDLGPASLPINLPSDLASSYNLSTTLGLLCSPYSGTMGQAPAHTRLRLTIPCRAAFSHWALTDFSYWGYFLLMPLGCLSFAFLCSYLSFMLLLIGGI